MLSFTANVNFQPDTAIVPSGYLKDSGAAYASRGNGFTYGWNATNANGVERNVNSDQRYDTLLPMQTGGSYSWNMAVPNGTYQVHLVAGDPSAYNSTYKINVENVLAASGTPTSTNRFFDGYATVTVSDGNLTISNASGASNNKICFVDIKQIQTPSTPTTTNTYVSDLAWTSATNGWGPVEKDRSNGEQAAGDGKVISLNGVTYAKGLGAHAASNVVYNLGGKYSTFTANVGVDDEVGANGSVVFQVLGDGKVLYDSGTMTGASASKSISVAVAGVMQLALVVNDAGNGNNYDHADWANAQLQPATTSSTVPAPPSSLAATVGSTSQINLAWTDNASNETGFRVERSLDGVNFTSIATLGANATSYSDSGLAAGTAYSYRVAAYNASGNSAYSNTARATTANSTPTPTTGPGWYVATTGSDSNPGTLDAPFRTIQKAASVAKPGDTVLIRGGTYRETVTPANSGTASAPITFKPYNNESVTIDGADPITGWSSYSGSIYKAPMSWTRGGENDQIFVDGQMMTYARWPNTTLDVSHPTVEHSSDGWSSFNNGVLVNNIKDPALTQPAGYWNGATIHIAPGAGWLYESQPITGFSVNAIQYTSGLGDTNFAAQAGDPYFITGKFQCLDSADEWFRDASTGSLYLWTPASDNPAGHTVEAKHRDYAFDLSGKSYVTVQGLNLFASSINSNASSSHLLIDGINAKYVSHFETYSTGWNTHAEDSGIILAGSYDTLQNSEIAYSAGNGVTLLGDHHTVTNNVIHDVDYAGVDDAAISTGYYGTTSTNHQITYNTLFNSGRGLLLFRNASALKINHNDLYNSGLQTTDIGAMYTYKSDGAGTEIAYNLVHDSVNHEAGYGNAGIYLDNGSSNYVLHHNMVWNTQDALMLNDPSTNNLVYNNTLAGTEFSLAPHATMPGTQIKNNIFTNWIDYSTGPTLSNNLTRDTDPQFTDAAANNFQLRSTSPAINAGAVLSPYTDGYAGTAPDIGAYEYGQTPWKAGATIAAVQQIPATPTHLTATVVSANQINLAWQDNSSNETRFVIERSSDGKVFNPVATVGANTTTWSDLNQPLGTYTYRVRADNGSYSSGYSNFAVGFTGRDAYANIGAQTYDAQSGTSSWWAGVGSLDAGDWLRYNKVNFGSGGARQFVASIAVPPDYAGRQIEIHLDSQTGPVIGTLTVASTGDWGTMVEQSTSVSGATGLHDVFLLIKGGPGAGNMSYFRFVP